MFSMRIVRRIMDDCDSAENMEDLPFLGWL
jgi:hypothetical protein